MRRWVFLFAAIGLLQAADEPKLAVSLKAESDFNRVVSAPEPPLHDTIACIQSEASLIAVAGPDELPQVHYRKGYCTLAGATITHNAAEYSQAAEEFEKAIAAWPAKVLAASKKAPPEQMPSALRVLAAMSRLLSAPADQAVLDRAQAEMASAEQDAVCTPSVMTVASCQAALRTGRHWLGWFALRRDDLDTAERNLADAAGSGWPEWVAGRRAFRAANYAEAAKHYRESIALAQMPSSSWLDRIGPHPDLPTEMTDLGGAQLLAGDTTGAIATLDAALKADPRDPRAFYLRGRAKEMAKQLPAALADYNLASRAAFAKAQDLASGEAHLYRGILMYRRKDFSGAEDEFSSALSFQIPADLRSDAAAWRHMAAVAGGACQASRSLLDRSLSSVSPYFPKTEARNLIAACPATASGSSAVIGLK